MPIKRYRKVRLLPSPKRRISCALLISWQRVRPADFLRGLVGTPQLGRSVIGMIGAANARGTMHKQGDAWYPRELAALYPYRAQPWTPAAVISGRTQARQRAVAGGLARGA